MMVLLVQAVCDVFCFSAELLKCDSDILEFSSAARLKARQLSSPVARQQVGPVSRHSFSSRLRQRGDS